MVLIAILILFLVPVLYSSTPSKITTKNYSSLTPPPYGYKNYSELVLGNLPLILSVPHDGELTPQDIPDRNASGAWKLNDLYTREIGKLISKGIVKRLGKKRNPYMIINHLGRSKIDVNRPLEEGAEVEETIKAWNDYHHFINYSVGKVESDFGCGLLIDLHGHAHPENRVELGYELSSKILSLPTDDLNGKGIASKSSIKALFNRKQGTIKFSNLLRGKHNSLGGKLQNLGYDTVPSYAHKFPMGNEKYFRGGFITRSYHNERSDAIQIELPKTLRIGNKELREKTSDDLAEALVWFMQEYYCLCNSNNCK